jgi:DnaK suppressor protein
MSKATEPLDAAFVERKRQQLMVLRDQLRTASGAAESEENVVRGEANEQAREYEDDAQKLDRLETEGELVRRTLARLAQIERALTKIDEGTYGYSDVSGHRIPDARLEAMPDAIHTLVEQETLEAK